MIVILNNKSNLSKDEFLNYQEELKKIKSPYEIVLCPTYLNIGLFNIDNINIRNSKQQKIRPISPKNKIKQSINNQSSINTIRITTYIVNDEIHHVPIALRIGRDGKKVDNITLLPFDIFN